MQLMGKIWPRRVPCCMLSADLCGTLFDAVYNQFLAQKGSMLHAFGCFCGTLLTQFTISFWPRRVPCFMLSGTLFDAVYHQFLAEKTGHHTIDRKPTEAVENQLIFVKNRPLGEGKGEGDCSYHHSLLPPAKAGAGGFCSGPVSGLVRFFHYVQGWLGLQACSCPGTFQLRRSFSI